MDFADLKSHRAMDMPCSKRFSPEAVTRLRTSLEKPVENSFEEKKAETAAGRKDAGPDLPQKIYDKLLETQPLVETSLTVMARERAKATLQERTEPGGLEASGLPTLEPALRRT